MEDTTEKPNPLSTIPASMGRRELFQKVADPGRKAYHATQFPNLSSPESSLQRYLKEKKIHRKNFLIRSGALGAFLLWGSWLMNLSRNGKSTPLLSKAPQSEQKEETARVARTIEINPNSPLLNEILSLPLGDPARLKTEERYVKEAQNMTQVDLGFYAVTNTELRAYLLDKKYALRLKEPEKYRNLTPEELSWVKVNQVHPEILAICTDYYFEAKQLLEVKLRGMVTKAVSEGKTVEEGTQEFFKWFRPDLFLAPETDELPKETRAEFTIEDLLPNPGALVRLVLNETGAVFPDGQNRPFAEGINRHYGGVYIGKRSALKLLNGADKEDATKSMIKLFQDLNQVDQKDGATIKLIYDVNQVPGSEQSGDIGSVQFRPNTALRVHQFLKENFGFYLHPLSLKAIIAVAIFLARGERWREASTGEIKNQYGFVAEKFKKISRLPAKVLAKFKRVREASVDKWNALMVDGILDWGRKYQENIIDKGVFANNIVLFYQGQAG